jgi:hypothetical protein
MLEAAPRIVRSLLDDVAAGRFLPTMDKDDCRFCEFAAICRAKQDGFTSSSPRAEWARANAEAEPHYAGMMSRRTGAGEE